MSTVYLTTTYFGPVQYFTHLVNFDQVFIEIHENYQRQSWRNRCLILGANGVIPLSVPIVAGHSPGQPIQEVKISYHSRWQKIHQRSVESAYKHAPYYEYYYDELVAVWQKKFEFLLDLNLYILDVLYKILPIDSPFNTTREYESTPSAEIIDYRDTLHPKSRFKDPLFTPSPYYQVFSDRFGFIPNLSILDLFFCEGPSAIDHLRQNKRPVV